jgi:arylsulfatase A-like enzyme
LFERPSCGILEGMEATTRRRVSGISGWALAASLAIAPSAVACRQSSAASTAAPGVLIVAIDGLRADHVSCYGYERPTTPNLDRLADGGVVFEETFANSPSLLPSHVSLLTGCEPFVARRHLLAGVDDTVERRWLVPESVPHLAVEFLAHGYDTAAFVDHPRLAPVFGFTTGFEVYEESDADPDAPRDQVGAPWLTAKLVQWLRGVDRDRSWFAYLHLHDLERSWSRPDPHWERFFSKRDGMEEVPPVGVTDSVFFAIPFSRWRGGSRSMGEYEAQYDGHLRGLDENLERLFGSLSTTGRLEETTIAVVGTLGIQFGEAGRILAGGRYSMADIHVPWILSPGRSVATSLPPGGRISDLASLSDVAPTLLELSGLPVPRGIHGISQAPLLLGPVPETPLRPLAFSSCGIQDGGVVIGKRWCYEYLLPGRTEDALFRRSWFGENEEHEGEPRLRFYDRITDPFPSLSETAQASHPVEFEVYQEAAMSWFAEMEEVRKVVQATALFSDPLPRERVEALQRKGLLIEDL